MYFIKVWVNTQKCFEPLSPRQLTLHCLGGCLCPPYCLFGFFKTSRLTASRFFAREILPPPFTYGLEPLPKHNTLVYPLGVVSYFPLPPLTLTASTVLVDQR